MSGVYLAKNGNSNPKSKIHSKERGQSSFEMLSTYGFALIILVVLASIIYVFATIPRSIPENQCSFSGAIVCKTLAFGSNSTSSRAVFLFSNEQQYAIENPSATLNISGIGTYSGGCTPNFVLPGGDLECVINFNKQITKNQITNGNIYLSATVCSLPTQTGCDQPIQQTYGGTFITHVNSLVPPPGCSITLSVTNSTETANGVKDLLTANVKILNFEVAGATVNFTSNSSLVTINPHLANTDSNGNAQTYISSETPGTVNITATFGTCQTASGVNFTKPVFITFTSNISGYSSGFPIVNAGGQWYSSLPKALISIAGANILYNYNQTVSFGPGERFIYNSINGCGATSQSGTIVVSNSNCTVSGNYLSQYYLTLQSSPSGAGTLGPGSGFSTTGASVHLTETPATGYQFVNWSCSGPQCYRGGYTGSAPSPTVGVNAPMTETANFQLQSFAFTEGTSGSGTATPGSNTYTYGSFVTINAIPNSGWTFVGWTGIGAGSYTGNSLSTTIIIDNAITENAVFQQTILPAYSFTENAVPSAGGSVSPGNGNYLSGNTVSISETPNSGYTFTGWSCTGAGCYSGAGSSSVITITSNVVETAAFASAGPTYYVVINFATTNSFVVYNPYSGNIVSGNYLIGAYPGSLHVASDGQHLYSLVYGSGFTSGYISTLNPNTATVTNTISGTGSEPYSALLAPGGRYLYLYNSYSASVNVVDTTADTIIATVHPIGSCVSLQAGTLIATPDGNDVLVMCDSNDQLATISTSSYTVTNTITTSGSPYAGVFRNGDVYASVLVIAASPNNGGGVDVINLTSGTTTPIPYGPGAANSSAQYLTGRTGTIVLSSNGGTVYSMVSDPSVNPWIAAISTSTDTITSKIQLTAGGGGETQGMMLISGSTLYALSPSGTGLTGGNLFTINTNTNVVSNTITLPYSTGLAETMGLSPSGNLMYVLSSSSGNGYLSIVNLTNDVVTNTILVGSGPQGMAIAT